MAADAKTAPDTYPAINFALEQLKDKHSFLTGRNGRGTKTHTLTEANITLPKRAHCGDVLRRHGHAFGFLLVEMLGAARNSTQAQSYARSLQQSISDILKSKPSVLAVNYFCTRGQLKLILNRMTAVGGYGWRLSAFWAH